MNKIIKANIQGFVFPIDEQAYERLNAYFDRLKLAMPDAEAFEDIERRVAELFSYRLGQGLEAIFMAQVEAVIQQIGEADEFMDAATPSVDAKTESVKRLYRNPNDKRISGVASGLAAYFGLDATLVRVFFAASIFVGGFGALLYLVLVLLVPEATTPAQQLEMRGEAVNVENLARTMKNGIQENLDKHGPRAKSWLQSRSKGLARVMGFVLLIAFLLIAVPLAFSVVASAGAFGFIYGMVQQYFFVSSEQAAWVFAAALVMLLVPLFLLLFQALKLLLSGKSMPVLVRWVLGLTWLTAFGYLLFTTLELGRDFSHKGQVETQYNWNECDSAQWLQIGVKGVSAAPYRSHELEWVEGDKRVVFRGESDWNELLANRLSEDVELELAQTIQSKPFVRVEMLSRGSSAMSAMKRASLIEYPVEIKGNELRLSQYFGLGSGPDGVWRKQEVRVRVYVPLGYKVALDPSCRRVIRHLDGQALHLGQDPQSQSVLLESTAAGLQKISILSEPTNE